MATQSGSCFAEGHSTNRPPLFNGTNYSYWKARMRIFIQASDYELWGVIINGPSTPTHTVDGTIVPKPERDWNDNDRRMAQLNAKAINILYCSLDSNEFNRISTCNSAKEIWDRLEVTHEGTNQVKESKINILVHKYELFTMEQTETITCMFTRFTDIVNGLKSLGKTYSNADLVRKILRSLPRSWEAKVTAIQEAKDLNALPLEELLGSLMTHELTMKQHVEEDTKRKKTIALKAAEKEESSSNDDEEEDDETALLAKKFRKFMRKRSFHKKKFGARIDGEKDKRKDKEKEKEKEPLICYECKKPGHFKYDCPLLKKAYKKKKKAYMATWTDSDESSSEEEEQKEVANICFMANNDDNDDEVSSESSNDEFTFDEMFEAFNELMIDFKSLKKKYKSLKSNNVSLAKSKNELALEVKNLTNEKEELRKERDNLNQEIDLLKSEAKNSTKDLKDQLETLTLEKEHQVNDNDLLKKEVKKYKDIVEKFTLSSTKLNMILDNQKAVFDKAGLGYNTYRKQKSLKNIFVKANQSNITCFKCNEKGHKAFECKTLNKKLNNVFKGKKIWVPKGTLIVATNHEGPKKAWVPKHKV